LSQWNEPFEGVVAKLLNWGHRGILALPNLAAALLVFLLFWMLGRLIRRGMTRALARTSAPRQIQRLLVTLTGILVVATGLFIALGILQLDKALTSLLAGAGILGLALSFAVQDITANFISGIFLAIRRPFRIGELIETNGFQGTVERIDLRATVLRRPSGQIVMIPNKMIFEHPILSFSQTGERRVEINFGVAYKDDLDAVEGAAREALEGLPQRNAHRPVEVFFIELGAATIQMQARVWLTTTSQADYQAARSEGIKRIKSAFGAAKITMPTGSYTLDFADGGGERLSQAWRGKAAPAVSSEAPSGRAPESETAADGQVGTTED
jgi:small conductance mechanosensitive channel